MLRVLLPLALLATGCDDIRTYVIDAGDHSSSSRPATFSGSELRFRATFDGSAIYETRDPRNQADINKLLGFSDCTSHHHTNSARFGWRWYEGELQIHAYVYVDGARQHQQVGTVAIDEASEYLIEIEGDTYTFTLDGHSVSMPRGCEGNGGVKYKLWPYFGGDEEAPHEISITIEQL